MNLLLVRRLATVLLFVAIPSLPVRPQDLKPNSNPEERSRKDHSIREPRSGSDRVTRAPDSTKVHRPCIPGGCC